MFKKKINNKIIMLAAIFIIIALQFFYAKPAYADNILLDLLGSAVKGVLNIASAPIFMLLGTIVVGVSWLVGQISTLFVYLLFYVASYNSFIKEGIVGYGWVIVRDICNMFFILILLIIAFATILRQENYNAKKLLPKLLIMAVLINFSKTICGLAIDFSQVIMLTFVNGLNAGDSFFGHGALVNALGLNKLLSIKTATVDTLKSAFTEGASPMSVFGSLLFGFILLMIACIVVGIYTMVLIFRIVMLWILIILSPLAFLAMAIPAGAKYASQWSSEFTKYLIVGPAMAFFLWLALLLSQASFTTNFNLSQSIGAAKTGFDSQILTEMGNPQNLANFIVVIIFLLAGLMVAQQMGVAGGGAAGNAVAKIKATGIGAAKLPLKGASWGARKFALKTGFEIRPTKIIAGFKEGLEEKKRKEEFSITSRAAADLRTGKLRGALGASKDFAEASAHGLFWRKAWQPWGKDDKKGKIWQTKRVGNLNKKINKAKGELKNLNIGSSEYEAKQKEINEYSKQLETVRAPYTFHAEQSRNSLIREAMGKIGDNDNEEDLIAMFNDAVSREDKEMAASVMLVAAKVGHLNEIIQSQRATEDVKDEQGNVVIKKGDYLDESGYGFNALVNQKLIGELGMTDQEAFSHQSTASSLAKSIGHFNLAESIGVKNGLMFQRNVRGADGQQERSRVELRKVDAEKAIRNFNRLAWMDEIQFEEDGKIKRTNKLSDLGKANFAEWGDIIEKELKYRRFNKNAAMNMYNTAYEKGGLYEYVKQLEKQGKTDYFDADAGEYKSYKDLAHRLILYGRNIAEGEEAVESLTGKIMAGEQTAELEEGEVEIIEKELEEFKTVLRKEAEAKQQKQKKKESAESAIDSDKLD